jgi:tetratricopeptide (TPR) repeat protein
MTAFVFTLFFAVHPLATQTVSLIVGRNDSLLTIFVLGSFIYLIDTLRDRNIKKYLLHILCLLSALFTKETAVLLPFVFGVYLLTFVGWKTLWEERKKYVYVLIGWITTYFIYFKSRQAVLDSFTSNRYDFIDMLASIYQNSSSLISTVGKIFLPFNLSVFPVLTDMTLVYGVFSIIVLCVYIIFSKEKNYKLILFGLSWFILFIVLTLIKPLGMFQNFSENRIYLPMLGFIFIILGIGKIEFLSKVFQKKNIRILVISLLILTFSTITIIRNTYYKDGLSFWKNAVDTSPNNAPAFNNLGGMYYAQQDYTQAEYYYLEALKLNPTEKLAHYNLGLVYENQGKSSLAIEHYKQEIELGPRLKAVYIRLGELYVKEGKIKEAEGFWKNMYESHPDRLGALYNLINLNFYHKKNISQTIFYAKQAKVKGLELPPEVFDLLNK